MPAVRELVPPFGPARVQAQADIPKWRCCDCMSLAAPPVTGECGGSCGGIALVHLVGAGLRWRQLVYGVAFLHPASFRTPLRCTVQPTQLSAARGAATRPGPEAEQFARNLADENLARARRLWDSADDLRFKAQRRRDQAEDFRRKGEEDKAEKYEERAEKYEERAEKY